MFNLSITHLHIPCLFRPSSNFYYPLTIGVGLLILGYGSKRLYNRYGLIAKHFISLYLSKQDINIPLIFTEEPLIVTEKSLISAEEPLISTEEISDDEVTEELRSTDVVEYNRNQED